MLLPINSNSSCTSGGCCHSHRKHFPGTRSQEQHQNPLEGVFQMLLKHPQELRLQPESQPNPHRVTPRAISAPFSLPPPPSPENLFCSSTMTLHPFQRRRGKSCWGALGGIRSCLQGTVCLQHPMRVRWRSILPLGVDHPPLLADKDVY